MLGGLPSVGRFGVPGYACVTRGLSASLPAAAALLRLIVLLPAAKRKRAQAFVDH